MKKLKHLSPTSISLWKRDRQEFYLKYLADNSPPRIPQNQAMSIGAAFDAYIKSYLHVRLHGKDPRFEFNTLFESQVEPQNRDWALRHGGHVFATYRDCGALSNLMLELADADRPPHFELVIEKRIAHSACISGIPILGIPDISFKNSGGKFLIYDWKVNGYCSARTTSPYSGYVRLFEANGSKRLPHKDCVLMEVDGLMINIAVTLDQVNKDWATQLTLYSWIMGAEVGSDFIVGIDQIVGKNGGEDRFADLRVACHRLRVNSDWQMALLDEISEIWNRIEAGQIFDEDNSDRCAVLDMTYSDVDHEDNEWFESLRTHKDY